MPVLFKRLIFKPLTKCMSFPHMFPSTCFGREKNGRDLPFLWAKTQGCFFTPSYVGRPGKSFMYPPDQTLHANFNSLYFFSYYSAILGVLLIIIIITILLFQSQSRSNSYCYIVRVTIGALTVITSLAIIIMELACVVQIQTLRMKNEKKSCKCVI